MELSINSPAYFKEHYGINDDVYRYCQRLYEHFIDKNYSDKLSIIGIVPAVAPKDLYEEGLWEESTQIISAGKCAIVHIRMDFDSYYMADSEGKTELTKDMIIRAVKRVSLKENFDWEKFKYDLNSFSET